jgi:hypothetical protein
MLAKHGVDVARRNGYVGTAVAAAAATHAELEVELHGRNLIAFKKFVEDYSSASISWPNRSAKV